MKWPALVVAIVSSGTVLAQTELPSFEAASIKLNRSAASGVGATTLVFEQNGRFKAVNEPLRLIAEAYRSNYQLRRFEIEGIPRSMDSDRFDVDAVLQGNPSFSEQRQMLQRLLADRFTLAVHRETREMPVYALVKAGADGRLGERFETFGCGLLQSSCGRFAACCQAWSAITVHDDLRPRAARLVRDDRDSTGRDGAGTICSATGYRSHRVDRRLYVDPRMGAR
jgi:hypothetical protein